MKNYYNYCTMIQKKPLNVNTEPVENLEPWSEFSKKYVVGEGNRIKSNA